MERAAVIARVDVHGLLNEADKAVAIPVAPEDRATAHAAEAGDRRPMFQLAVELELVAIGSTDAFSHRLDIRQRYALSVISEVLHFLRRRKTARDCIPQWKLRLGVRFKLEGLLSNVGREAWVNGPKHHVNIVPNQ